MACLPLMQPGGSRRRADVRRHRRLAGLRLDGRRQGRAGVCTATWRATSARRASASNLVSAGPLKTLAAKAIPGFERLRGRCGATRAPLGWDLSRPRADRARRRGAAQRLLPDDHRRDRPRRRRLPRDGRLSAARDRLDSVPGVTPHSSSSGSSRARTSTSPARRSS